MEYVLGRIKHKDDTYSPRDYISYSSWRLWKSNKEAYRKRYYENCDAFENAETIYGKKIAELLEDKEEVKKHPVLSLIPHYPVSEQPFDVKIKDLRVKGYIDLFNPEKLSFAEVKSGHIGRDGNVPWDMVKVHKHEQLPFYSLLIQTKYGKVDRVTWLHWLETQWKKKEIEFAGHTLTASTRELELTGQIRSFRRIITQSERDRIKKDILRVAEEIHQDYEWYMKII